MGGRCLIAAACLVLLGAISAVPDLAVAAERGGSEETRGETRGESLKPVVGVIDLHAVLGGLTAARMVASQREGYLNTYQAMVADKEKELRAVDRTLARDRPTVDADTFKKRRDAFQQQVSTFQKDVGERRRNLERAYTQAMNKIQSVVINKTRDIAISRGMNMVVYRSQVVLFDPSMDITKQVLAAVNKILPKVNMPDPEQLPPSTEGK